MTIMVVLSYHLTECGAGFYGINCSTPCRYPNYGKDCQQECSECGQEKCNSTPGCLSSDVLISRGTRKIIANVIVRHFSYIDLFNFITVLL